MEICHLLLRALFIYLFNNFYLLNFWLCWVFGVSSAFLWLWRGGLLSGWGAWASVCGGFSCWSLTQLISIEPPSEYTWHFGAQEAGVGNAVPLPAWQTLLKLSKLPASFSSLVHKKSNVYCSSQGRRKDRKEEGGESEENHHGCSQDGKKGNLS